METRIDSHGRTVTRTIDGEREIYSCDGISVSGPIGTGWEHALSVLDAHVPVSVLVDE